MLALAAATVGLASSPNEEKLRQLSDDFDRAVFAQNQAAVLALLDPHYLYIEPDIPEPRPDDEALTDRAAYRLSRELGWAGNATTVRITGDTAVITGMYQVLSTEGTSRASPTGWFTSTWKRTGGTWKLLAEHRSRNLTTTNIAPALFARDPSRPPPQAVARVKLTEPGAKSPSTGAPTVDVATTAGPATTAGAAAPATTAETREESRVRHGTLPLAATNLFRAYEPNTVGYTYDEGDDPFLDFTFSAMFPLLPKQPYPAERDQQLKTKFFRRADYLHRPYLYFAANLRGSQYIGTRPSSPVVGKRFNPLLSARIWARDSNQTSESEENFIEFYYAHESNGQFIASLDRFRQQLRVYLDQDKDFTVPDSPEVWRRRAYRSARDNISRGWDYVGVQFARDADTRLPDAPWMLWLHDRDVRIGLSAKFNYYLKTGVLQGDKEEYNVWEQDPEGKPRDKVDGISLRYTFVIFPKRGAELKPLAAQAKQALRFERRYAFTWTTGYDQPFRYNTFKAEASVLLFDTLPLTLWGRSGYNGDLIDYFRKDYSAGISLSFWDY